MDTPAPADSPPGRTRIDRRKALTGLGVAGAIAWTAPIVLSSPAYAASSDCLACDGIDLAMVIPTGSNGWAELDNGAFNPAGRLGVVLSPSDPNDINGGLAGPTYPVPPNDQPLPGFITEVDPTGPLQVTYTKSIPVCAGTNYQFSFNYYIRNPNAIAQTLNVIVDGTQIFTVSTKQLGIVDGTRYSAAPTFLAPTTGPVTFQLEWTMPGAGVGDDITVGSITCAEA